MNSFDLFVIALLLISAVVGARAGFLSPVMGLVGAAAGFGVAVVATGALAAQLAEIEQPTRALVGILGLGFLVLAGEGIGAGVGATISRRAHPNWMQPIDLVGGGLVGVAHGILLVWLVGGMLATGIAPGISRAAQESATMDAIDEWLPPPAQVAGQLIALFEATALPELFHGLEPPPAPPVDLPGDEQARVLAESAIPSTARVDATGCGFGIQVGSAFFVNANQAVTNAHVVAGAQATTVTHGGVNYTATVVLFDPDTDLALLHVPGVEAPSLQLAGEAPSRGQAAVAIGFPGGGPMNVSPAAVTASYQALGPDIYGGGQVQRAVVEMRGTIRQGNSGGPLVTAPGVAGGVVFGGSRLDPSVGYAITAPAAAAVIGPGLGSTAAVDTGPCR